VRKIIHIDMDAFYASIEQRNDPNLRGKPVIVSGPPNSRSVVCTCSYEARKFGIHSAMPASHAYRLCPHGIFVPPHFSEYQEASRLIHQVFSEYTDMIEPLSLDEAYLDVTENKNNFRSSSLIAREIKRKIKEKTELNSSAGVSYNKFLAKIASDWEKPEGFTVIPPARALYFLENLPIGKFYGIGKKTEEQMKNQGILIGKDLKRFEKWQLIELFGKSGSYYYDVVRGIDNRPVETKRTRKSIGREETFSRDILEREEIIDCLWEIAEELEKTLKRYNTGGKTITLKVKYYDFRSITRSHTCSHPLTTAKEFMESVSELLEKTEVGRCPVRLIGLSLTSLTGEKFRTEGAMNQLDLFCC
jgi:DNA polymerase IV